MRDDDDRLSDALESLTNRAHTAEAELGRLRADNERLQAESDNFQQLATDHYHEARTLRGTNRSLRAAVDAARALHQPEECDCENCDGLGLRCPQCIGHWPCDTGEVLAAALGATTTPEEPEQSLTTPEGMAKTVWGWQ